VFGGDGGLLLALDPAASEKGTGLELTWLLGEFEPELSGLPGFAEGEGGVDIGAVP
jgi:hypothetical protein